MQIYKDADKEKTAERRFIFLVEILCVGKYFTGTRLFAISLAVAKIYEQANDHPDESTQ